MKQIKLCVPSTQAGLHLAVQLAQALGGTYGRRQQDETSRFGCGCALKDAATCFPAQDWVKCVNLLWLHYHAAYIAYSLYLQYKLCTLGN